MSRRKCEWCKKKAAIFSSEVHGKRMHFCSDACEEEAYEEGVRKKGWEDVPLPGMEEFTTKHRVKLSHRG